MKKKDYIYYIEENLAETFIAIIFLLGFICAGIITSYFIDNQLGKDIILGISALIGMITLSLTVINNNKASNNIENIGGK